MPAAGGSREPRGPVTVGHLTLGAIHNRVEVCRRLARDPRIDLTAIYESTAGVEPKDFGYGQPVAWDSDLLEGYKSVFLKRAGRDRNFTVTGIFDPDVISLLARERFEVLWIHSYVYATHALAGLTQRALGGNVVLRDTQTLIDEVPGVAAAVKRRMKRAGIRVAYGRPQGLAVSSHSRRWFEAYGFDADRVHFAPNEIDWQATGAQALELRASGSEMRSELGISEGDGPVILWVGRFAEMKQPHVLLDAFKGVRERCRCALLMVGSGPLEESVRGHIAEDAIPDVHLPGFMNRTEIARAYAAADVFTLPSLFGETFGLVVNEAMGAGLPVVVTDAVGCAPDLVREGENGFVVGRTDAGALERSLATLVENETLRRSMGDRSRSIIAGWTIDRTVDGVLSGIAAAVGQERWKQTSEQ